MDYEGKIVSDFEFFNQLGHGSSSVVYRVRRNNDEFALKLFSSHIQSKNDSLKRFFRETKILVELDHPNIVKGIQHGKLGNEKVPFLLMELIPGKTLAEMARNSGQFSLSVALGIITRMISALSYALTTHNVIHRDIKLENILITEGSLCKLIDFGLAQIQGTLEKKLDSSWEFNGAPRYRSPEKCKDFHLVDEKADVWSLGVVLYRLLTEKFPFETKHENGTEQQLINLIYTKEPTAPSELNPSIPDAVDALVLLLLSKDPNRRPTLKELLDILDPEDHSRHGQKPFLLTADYIKQVEERIVAFLQARHILSLRHSDSNGELFCRFERWINTSKSTALELINAHPKAMLIRQTLFQIVNDKKYPKMMSINGDMYPNPIYENRRLKLHGHRQFGNAVINDERYAVQITPLDVYLIKGFDKKGQPLILHYFSGTKFAGWNTWLCPHGYKINVPDLNRRMRWNARDLETVLGLKKRSCKVEYLEDAPFIASVKPNFGYGGYLVLYVFMLCSVTVSDPPLTFLKREFTIERGAYQRQYKWFYIEELQQESSIAIKNGDLLRGIHALFATSLVNVPVSIKKLIRI